MTPRKIRPEKDAELRQLETEVQSSKALSDDEERLRPKLDAADRRHEEILRRSREFASRRVIR